jgi:tetratricopeptide (TPR) repeat protein
MHLVLDRRDAAATAIEEATQIHQRLAAADPVYQPAAAELWSDLGMLRWRLDQPDAALAATRRAVDLGRTLAADDPAQRLRFALALQNLAIFLGLRGRRAEAIPLARERLDVLHKLARDDPERFNPIALGRLLGQAVVLSIQDGDQDCVWAELLESLEVSRILGGELPADRMDDMRASWSAAAQALAANGQAELAEEIHRQLG